MADFRRLSDTVLVAPQIALSDIAEAAALGVTTVVSNRPDGEDPGQPTAAEVAQAAEAAGDPVSALERYDDALRAQPDNAEYTAARTALQKTLDNRQMQLASALSQARAAISARRYFAPAGNTARDAIEAALQVDPNNADARAMKAELPNLVTEAADALGREARYDEALALLGDAIKQYPGDTRFAALSRSLEGQRDKIKLAAERQKLVADAQTLLSGGQLTVESARAIATAVNGLLKLDPSDSDGLGFRGSVW